MYNSDGYVLIDMSDVDLTRSSQNIPGIYKRVVEVIDTNKLALIINAGNNTPMAAIVHKRLNYYVINTTLFIFTINSNDIVIVEEAGTATVDVEIVPTLTEGTKIADFAIGSVEGSLYAPTQQSEINDNVTANNTTWSSDKISTELSGKVNSSDLATVATTGNYTDLTNKPSIPVLTDLIDDTTTATTSVWSSDKTASEIAAGAGVTIDDTTTSTTKTWSSDKINTELSSKANSADVYTKTEIDTSLALKANSADVYTKSEIDTSLAPLTKVKEQILYCSNGARIWVKRLGTTVQVEINESSQMTFSTSWTNVYTDNTYQTRAYLDSDLIGMATTLYVPIGIVNGHQIVLKIERVNRAIQIICDTANGIYPQGSGVYTLA